LFLICFLSSGTAVSQEINATITVVSPRTQTVDKKVFKSMEATLQDLINSRKWTNEIYTTEEKIEVTFLLTISEELSPTNFKGELNVQAVRPVYGSTYKTLLLSHLDKDFTFSYQENQPIQFAENAFTDNLTSVFAFYIYYILGMDHDSFAQFGGDKYFQSCQEVLNSLPTQLSNTVGSGWGALNTARNRYWMLENILNARAQPFRKAIYLYHRKGLDVAQSDVVAFRAEMVTALEDVNRVNTAFLNTGMIIQMFCNAKHQEIVEIFKAADIPTRRKVYDIMIKLDPAAVSRYTALK
ncbi:MAG: DUF4835 family protein, partial [Saprospiraceae bacterium]